MSTQECEKKNCSKEALLEAAVKLFSQKGYAAVSTRKIAEEAKVNLGAIQYHFGSKAQLFGATVSRLMALHWDEEPFRSFMKKVPASKEDAAKEVFGFIFYSLDRFCHGPEPQGSRLMYREILGEASQDPELREALLGPIVEEFFRPVEGQMRGFLQVLCPNASDLHIEFCVQSVFAQCCFYFTHRLFIEQLLHKNIGDTPYFDEIVSHVFRFTMTGLGLAESLIESTLELVKSLGFTHGKKIPVETLLSR